MRNEPGAVVCAYCNTLLKPDHHKTVLLHNIQEVTGALSDSFDEILASPPPKKERFMDFEIPSKGIVFIGIENGKPVAIQQENAFILGRSSVEIKTKEPLVDLAPFNALEYGISRVHALIRKTKDGYQITDLDSSNGTWLENQRLIPKKPYPLDSGNRIRLGRMHLLVFYPRNIN